MLGARNLGDQHRLHDQRGRHHDSGHDAPESERPHRRDQRERRYPQPHECERKGKLACQRQAPAAAAVDEAACRTADAHDPEQHACQRRSATLGCVRGDADFDQPERARVADDYREQRQESRLREGTKQAARAPRFDPPVHKRVRALE